MNKDIHNASLEQLMAVDDLRWPFAFQIVKQTFEIRLFINETCETLNESEVVFRTTIIQIAYVCVYDCACVRVCVCVYVHRGAN